MRAASDFAITDLVPHAGPMCLLDRVIEAADERLVAEVTVRRDGLFCDGHGVGAWVGIEYMAQAVAAWAGWRARNGGGEPKIGLLLGSRRYASSVARFGVGRCLRIEVGRTFIADNGLGQFDCRISDDGVVIATAALNVYEPDDPAEFLRSGHASGDVVIPPAG